MAPPTDDELLADLRGAMRGSRAEGASERAAESEPLSRLARYRIVRRLGEGGMGVVYEAEQEAPRRRVALKVLKSAALSASALRRFEHEAAVLARLDHPGIARIHEADALATSGGSLPFFAMELVDGRPLTDWADARRLPARARLELFARVCDAVQHAHERGVIHRDLKPANVLVTEAGEPKVLDFGIARTVDTEARLTRSGELGALLGTVAYMSPEQVRGDAAAVGTATDVHALGVVLFELLTGTLPRDLDGRTLPEVARALSDEPPRRLAGALAGCPADLDTIVAKALAPEPERRYRSAGALADDVRRFLADEPVLARPPSAFDQLGRFARRNRALVALAVLALAALVAGTVVSLSQARRALAALADTQRALQRAERVAELTRNVFRVSDPRAGELRDPSLREVLDVASERIGRDLAGEPDVEADLREAIGRAYAGVGAYDASERELRAALALREALGGGGPALGSLLNALGSTLGARRAYPDAEAVLRRALELCDEDGHASGLHDLGQALYGQGRLDEARACFEDALARMEAAAAPAEERAAVLSALALVHATRGDLAGAEERYRAALAALRASLPAEHPRVATTLVNLGSLLGRRGAHDESRALLEEALAIQRAAFGDEHASVALTLRNLGLAAFARRDFDAAAEALEEAYAMTGRTLGDESAARAATAAALALATWGRGDPLRAEELFAEACAVGAAALGAGHPDVIGWARQRADLLGRIGRPGEARDVARQQLEAALALETPPSDAPLAWLRATLGGALAALGELEEAERVLRDALAAAPEGSPARAQAEQALERLEGARER